MARFNARLPEAQKAFFEHAANIGGFRSLTDFILQAAQEMADRIVEDHQKLLVSERDRELFFDVLMNPPEPNQKLKEAHQKYQDLLNSWNS